MLNKRAQLSDTLTWVVATVAIVVLLVVFVYASGILGKANKIETSVKTLLTDDTKVDIDYFYEKTKIAYKINLENREKIESFVGEGK